MNKLTYKIAAGAAAFAFFATSAASSAFAYTDINVSGNGAFSRNNVRVNEFRSNVVHQNNFTDINNRVNTYQNTGNNRVFGNVGGVRYGFNDKYWPNRYDGFGDGSVTIHTGDANAYTNINNEAGRNYYSQRAMEY